MNTPLKVLTSSRSFLDDPKRWFQGGFGQLPDGSMIPVDGLALPRRSVFEHAVCLCIEGTLRRFCDTEVEFINAADEIRTVIGTSYLAVFNDKSTTTHADVVKALDEAIKNAVRR